MLNTKTIPEMAAVTLAELTGTTPSAYSEMETAFREYQVAQEDDAAFVTSCCNGLTATHSDLPVVANDDDSAVTRYVEPETTVRCGECYAQICWAGAE
jgi:hypothetical protein